jgi:hypothetical protein
MNKFQQALNLAGCLATGKWLNPAFWGNTKQGFEEIT